MLLIVLFLPWNFNSFLHCCRFLGVVVVPAVSALPPGPQVVSWLATPLGALLPSGRLLGVAGHVLLLLLLRLLSLVPVAIHFRAVLSWQGWGEAG